MKPARRHLKPKELNFLGMKITQIFPCCVAHRVCSAQPANAGYLDIFYTWAVRLFDFKRHRAAFIEIDVSRLPLLDPCLKLAWFYPLDVTEHSGFVDI